MIERFYLKDYLSFEEAELELKNGLVVFSGPSGSGKSILMEALLSSLGQASCDASVCESSVSWQFDGEAIGIESDEINVFKHIKKEKSRYFINNQSLSRKAMSVVASGYLRHLSLKDYSDFENENLLDILDARIAMMGDSSVLEIKKEYRSKYDEFVEVQKALQKIEEEEKRIVELKEFAAFEIQKIEGIAPVVGEDEELLQVKKELSKKEKIQEEIERASEIFNFEHYVSFVLESLEIDSGFFDDAMNQLRFEFDKAQERFDALEDVDVEGVLDRLEDLGSLKRRYGSIEEALSYKEQKQKELEEYENIEVKRGDLQERYERLNAEVFELAQTLSDLRKQAIQKFENDLNSYLEELYLRDAQVTLTQEELDANGQDRISLVLSQTQLSKVSTGEFNRLRLAILALKSECMSQIGGVLMLDEIDANLSGEESMSVAKVLKKLTKNFQIFVISHQPQLTSMGDQHFLVYKDGTISKTKELDFEQRVQEIARIISGDVISEEAKGFARELLEAKK